MEIPKTSRSTIKDKYIFILSRPKGEMRSIIEIDKALKTLTPMQEMVLRLRMESKTLREIASKYSKTIECIRQIELKALHKCMECFMWPENK